MARNVKPARCLELSATDNFDKVKLLDYLFTVGDPNLAYPSGPRWELMRLASDSLLYLFINGSMSGM